MVDQLLNLVGGVNIEPAGVLDIAVTSLLIYWLFSLIQGTRAVRLVIGAIVLYIIYVIAQALNLRLLMGIMQTGAVVGLLALVVVFQPELRRALERLGRVGSFGWIWTPAAAGHAERLAAVLAHTAATLSAQRIGALIVVERETGIEDAAESGVMLHADLSAELLQSIFTPHTDLHDGAVIIRGDRILAAGVVLPLSETSVQRERYGTRHRAAIGISEQTDAVALVVSEETGHMSLIERGRVLRVLDEERLRTALLALLRPVGAGERAASGVAALGSPIGRGVRRRGLRLRHSAHGDAGDAAVPSSVMQRPGAGATAGSVQNAPSAVSGSAGRVK
jgi:diadenylate cyclase